MTDKTQELNMEEAPSRHVKRKVEDDDEDFERRSSEEEEEEESEGEKIVGNDPDMILIIAVADGCIDTDLFYIPRAIFTDEEFLYFTKSKSNNIHYSCVRSGLYTARDGTPARWEKYRNPKCNIVQCKKLLVVKVFD